MFNRKGKRLLLAGLLLGLSCAVAACGGSKSKDSGSAPQAAPAEQADQAAGAAAKSAASFDDFKPQAGAAPEADAAARPSASVADQAGGAANSSIAGGIGPIAGTDAGTNRKVIYKANATMKVKDFDRSSERLRDAIHQTGSYVLQFSNTIDANEKGANYVIKVPADGFSSFIDRLRAIEKDVQLQMEGSDVTEEYVDLDARLQAKKTAEARLLAFMDKAAKTDDLVRFSNELAAVQEQIEQIKGRMRYLDQNVAYSTVNLRMYEARDEAAAAEEDKKPTFGERMAGAIKGSADVMAQIGQALLVFLAGLLPVAAVAAAVGIPAYILIRKRNLHRKQSSAIRRKEWNAAIAEQTATPAENKTADPGNPEQSVD